MRLGFFLDAAARLREPNHPASLEPAVLAALAESAGAQAILMGWTPGSGLYQERDYRLVREVVKGDLNLMLSMAAEYVDPVVKLRPAGVVLVATGWDGVHSPRELTTEVGSADLAGIAAAFHSAGVTVSALVAPEAALMKSAVRAGLTGVVLDSTAYGEAHSVAEAQSALDKIADAAMAAAKFGLAPAAGRRLCPRNLSPILGIRYLEEIIIGQAAAARALLVGLDKAISELAGLIGRG